MPIPALPRPSQSYQSSHDPQSDNEHLLGERYVELVRRAPTYRVRVHPQTKQATQQEEKPVAAHYGDNNRFGFEPGELYRIWRPANVETHLSTFLVMAATGSRMSCLKIVCPNVEEIDERFERLHERLQMKQHVPGLSRKRGRSSVRAVRPRAQEQAEEGEEETELIVSMQDPQRSREGCWINLLCSWTIDWREGYLFAYCGRLQDESLARVKEIHFDLYKTHLQVGQ